MKRHTYPDSRVYRWCLRLIKPLVIAWMRHRSRRYIHAWIWGNYRFIDAPEFVATQDKYIDQELWWEYLR